MTTPLLYKIAVPSPLRRLFDYLPPENGRDAPDMPLQPGSRVLVPFGRRQLVGLVVKAAENSAVDSKKLRPIDAVLDSSPLLPAQLFKLILWAADYYQHPPGDALATALPTLLRQGEAIPKVSETQWRLSTHGKGLPADALRRAPRQQQLLQFLQQHGNIARQQLEEAGIPRETLRILEKKGLVETFEIQTDIATQQPEYLLKEDHLPLYLEQQQALDAIDLHGYNTWLLQGETGSGKTEVYLQAIEKVLRYNRQAMVLVPEISLTPQTLNRFQQRFNCPLAVMHSGMTDRERLLAWDAARSGRAKIVIGTRSAIFTPMQSPGILIIDEEHDGSFKQQDGFRYSARDLAVMRASRENIPLLLGSATPSLESLYNCRNNRYNLLQLGKRPGKARQPDWQLQDIRRAPLNTGFSATLIDAIKAELSAGNQVLVLLNRRGYAPTLMCHDCGWAAECPRCDTRLNVHRQNNQLLCHHCEYRQRLPAACPHCHSTALQFLGQGTQKGESLLETLFPEVPILRVDRDSTRRKQAMQQVVEQVDSGQPCILVGTQILAKGHHFPGVTLVAILEADTGLFSTDFRAIERMGQLITQVAGRAGRGDKPGRVILQSHHCDHPLVLRLSQQGYPAFANALLEQRKHAGLPPYRAMALLRAEHAAPKQAEAFLQKARSLAEHIVEAVTKPLAESTANPTIQLLGPLPSPMEKRNGRYRYQLSLIADQRSLLQQVLARLCPALEDEKSNRQVRWSIDVDPQDTL